MELRLLNDPAYAEEFDITVDEITDQYLAGDFEPEERHRVEQYFLKSEDRRGKLEFASDLADHVQQQHQTTPTPAPVPQKEGFFERVLLLWRAQSVGLRTAAALGLLAVFGVAAYLAFTSNRTYLAITLTISNDTRGTGTSPQKVVLPSGTAGLDLTLRLPEGTSTASDYKVGLLSADGTLHDISDVKVGPESLTVRVPSTELKPGSYALKVSAVSPGGSLQSLPGSYYLTIE